MSTSFPNLYVETPTPNGIVFGAGALGGNLGHEDGALMMGLMFL